MTRKERLFRRLKELAGEGKSAQELADELGFDRANVSGDLNKLWKEGKVEKTSGRPVLFSVSGSGNKQAQQTRLDLLAETHHSLTTAVDQGKATILYPPRGLHILLLGETGVGKSMFAEVLHDYGTEIGRFSASSPFITFNCADYANNPQLLLGQLFGVKKGAFTGAQEQRGFIEKADGGVLLLDEVHRLPAEGQEMLFTFIDKGWFRRLGETEKERTANVLIIAATTEKPESALLKTFVRRIPMVIHLPALKERTLDERLRLILQFFKEETLRLGREVCVSANTIRAFLYYDCPNNVGQLKTDVRLICAKGYAEFVTGKKKKLHLYSPDLPAYIKEGLWRAGRAGENDKIIHGDYIFQPDETERLFTTEDADSGSIYELIERRFNELKASGVDEEELDFLMEMDIRNYFTEYMKGLQRGVKKDELSKLVDPVILQLTEEMVDFAEKRLRLSLGRKVFSGLALHIQASLERVRNGERIINPQLNNVRIHHKEAFDTALECLKKIEEKTGVNLPIDEAGFLAMFFLLDTEELDSEKDHVSVFVVMHGESTASSMADVTNQLLEGECVKAVDMPLSIEPEEVYRQVKDLATDTVSKAGVLLLVDMGSLVTFAARLEKDLGVGVKVIPAASTPHLLEAARKAMMGYSLTELYCDLQHAAEPVSEVNQPSQGKWAIITACTTGKGSALAIKKVLENHLRFHHETLEIIPMTVMDGPHDVFSGLKNETKLLGVVSDFPIQEDIPHFSIEEVLNLKAVKELQTIIDTEETYAKMAETIENHLKHVKAGELITEIRNCLGTIEKNLNEEVDRNDLIGIVLHMSCMVDRLISGENPVRFPEKETCLRENPRIYQVIKDALQSLEMRYLIQVDDDEICFLINFFHRDQTLVS